MYFKTFIPLLNLICLVYSRQNNTGPRIIRKNLKIAWMEKYPYIFRTGSFSADRGLAGLLRKTVWEFIELGCVDDIDYHIESFQVFSISDLIRLVQEGKAHVGLPVVRDNFGENSEYTKGIRTVKVLDHPGIEFIAASKTNKQALSVILIAVFQAWPLLFITMLLTAIAGVIVWALVRLMCFNFYLSSNLVEKKYTQGHEGF